MVRGFVNILFEVLFFCVGFSFTYFNSQENDSLTFYLKPLITLTLLTAYLINTTKKYNSFFTFMLVFAFLGDLFFNLKTHTSHILGLGSFLSFVLLLILLISKEAKEIVLNTFLQYLIPFLVVFFLIVYFFFDNENILSIIYLIIGVVIALLCAFSFYYYLKDRSTKSLYYFLGCMCFIITSFTKMYNSFYGYYNLTKILNNLSYVIALYFLYKGVIISNFNKELIEAENELKH